MTKQARRPCQSERRSSGAARGDYEAFVPYKNVRVLLVAAWKSTFLLPAVTLVPIFAIGFTLLHDTIGSVK